MKYAVTLLVLLFLLSSCATQLSIKPFESDGCSSCPDGNWMDCCEVHDLAYWKGGTMKERWDADRALFSCVRQRTNFLWASVMFAAVRIGGFPYWPTSWRWGFGWRYAKGYGKLDVFERKLAEDAMGEALLPE